MHTPKRIKMQMMAVALSGVIFGSPLFYGCNQNSTGQPGNPTHDQMVAQGKYLVEGMGCNDCHTPMIMTANGPDYDSSRFLSGAPQNAVTPTSFDTSVINVAKTGGAIFLPSGAILGGWGISFPANITSDSTTGIGGWDAATFIRVFRLGKYQGIPSGRPLLPPMPWPSIRNLTDADLAAIFTYLQTLPAVKNRVPSPISFNQIQVKN